MKKILLFFASIGLSATTCLGAEALPFKVTEKTYLYSTSEISNRTMKQQKEPVILGMTEKESIVYVSTEKVAAAVEEARKGVCNVLKKGHVKMWFAVTAKGQIWVAETSGEAGLEVQFDCATAGSEK